MKSWEDSPGPKVPVPLWWLEYNLQHLVDRNEFSIREGAKQIRRQLELFKNRQRRRDRFS